MATPKVERIKGIRDQIKRTQHAADVKLREVEELKNMEAMHTANLDEREKAELDRLKK